MPNTKGGKGYKNKKHVDSKMPECKWDDGQQFGRILKPLGNRRFRVYCNDNKERVCKLAGSIFKSQWCGEGTIVILSLRGLSNGQTGSGEDVGDIIDVIDHEWVGKLKKDEKISPALFANLDKIKIDELKKKVADGEEVEEDDLFDKNDEEEEEGKEEDNAKEADDPEKKKARALAREKKNKERDQERNAKRDQKNTDEINIDAI